MYIILGGDGKEYGPATPEQIRAWVTAGRANLDTLIKAPGTGEWKRLGDFPEFGSSEPAPPSSVPPPVGAGAAAIGADMIAQAGPLDISSCYERSWALLKENFWPLVGVTALVWLAQFFLIGMTGLAWVAHPGLISSRSYVVISLFSGVFYGGLYHYYLLKIRGQPAGIGDAFAGFTRAFAPLMLAGVMVYLLTSVGLLLLVLPGIYLMIAYLFTYLLIIDRKLGFWTAMEVSRRVITKQWWRVLGLALLGCIFGILGLAVLVIGVFVAVPLVIGALAYAYEDLCNPQKK